MLRRSALIVAVTTLVVAAPALALTRSGGPGNDTLQGTNLTDTLRGNGGDDRIDGFGGKDLLFGGIGRDRISGGSGADGIAGQSGHDGLSGGLGDDRIWGRSGDDMILGEGGDDELKAGSGRDRVDGGEGDDTIIGGFDDDGDPAAIPAGDYHLRGGDGDDTIAGGSGNDALSGDEGNDRLFGDNENDVVLGGPGFDVLGGGAGDDLVDARDAGRDLIDCGSGAGDRVAQDLFELSVVRCQAITFSPAGAVPLGQTGAIDEVSLRLVEVDYDPTTSLGRPEPGFLRPSASHSSALVVFEIRNGGAATAEIDLDRFSLIGASEHVVLTPRRDCSTNVDGVLDPDSSRRVRLSPSASPSLVGVCLRVQRRDIGGQVFLFDRDDVEATTPPGVAYALR